MTAARPHSNRRPPHPAAARLRFALMSSLTSCGGTTSIHALRNTAALFTQPAGRPASSSKDAFLAAYEPLSPTPAALSSRWNR
jgi:hypothetical protein